MKKLVLSLTMLVAMVVAPLAHATTIDIKVLPGADKLGYWEKGWGWTDTGWIIDANPNQVSHYYNYDYYYGSYRDAYLTFDLTGLTVAASDIVSATLNLNILSTWGDAHAIAGNISGGYGSVYADDGAGLKSFDIKDLLIAVLNIGAVDFGFSIAHTGQSGFTFGSAEGGDPAFLRITTSGGSNPNPVPEPSTVMMLGAGAIGLFGYMRTRRS